MVIVVHSNILVISIRVCKLIVCQLAIGDHFSWLELIYAFNIAKLGCTFMLEYCLINLESFVSILIDANWRKESLKKTEILYQSYDPCMQNEIPWAFISILRSDLSRVITVVSKLLTCHPVGKIGHWIS